MAVERFKPLSTLAMVLLGFGAFDLLLGAIRTQTLIGMFERQDHERSEVVFQVLQVGTLVALSIAAVAAVGCALRGRDRLDRALWWTAAVAAAVAFADVAFFVLTQMAGSEDPFYYRLYRHRWFMAVVQLANLGWIAAVSLAAARRVRRPELAPLAIAAPVILAVCFALAFIDRPFGELGVSSTLWLQYASFTVLPALAMFAAGWLCWVAAAAPASTAAAVGLESSPRWGRAADGLGLYRTALVWRLLITFGGYLFLLVAGLGRSPGMARFLMWSLPLAAIATGLVMLAGVVRYCQQPAGSPGKGAAVFAAVTMVLALLLDFFVLTQVLSAVTAEPSSYSAYDKVRDSLASAQRIAPWALAISFASLIALMISFRALATRLADTELAGRVAVMMVWLVLIAAALFGLRTWMGGLQPQTAELGLVLAFFAGIAALVVLIAYIGLVRAVEEKLRASSGGVEVPAARLVDE